MNTKSRRGDERRSFPFRRLFPVLGILALLVQSFPLGAQEIIDPRSGRLFLTTTDLSVPAGAVSLEIRR